MEIKLQIVSQIKMSVVKQTLGETGMSNSMEMDELVNYELLVLVNVLLHSSYQFFLLRSIGDSLVMQSSTWIMEKKDNKCRECAVKIMNWIIENNGYLELADISKPTFNESKLDGEFFFTRLAEVDKWIEQNFFDIKEKIHRSDYEKKNEVILMLEGSLSHVLTRGYF